MKAMQRSIIILLAGVAIGIIAGYEGGFLAHPTAAYDAAMTREGGYQFVNPLLTCDISEDISDPKLHSVKSALNAAVNELIAQGKASRISIYFRDMDRGRWTGIDQNDRFAPASLIKVPLLIAYLRDASTNNDIFR